MSKEAPLNVQGIQKNAMMPVTLNGEATPIRLSTEKVDITTLDSNTLTAENLTVNSVTGGGAYTITAQSDGDTLLTTTEALLLEIGDYNAALSGLQIKFNNQVASAVNFHHSSTYQYWYENGGASSTDYCMIYVGANGRTTLESVDLAGADAHMTLTADGDMILNSKSGNITAQNDGGNYTPTSDYHIATKKYVDEKKFAVNHYKVSHRMGAVNQWYVGNQSLATSITAGDFGVYEQQYAMFTTISAISLTAWSFTGYVTSTEPYELMMYDVTIPSDGDASASTVAQIGLTTNLASGGGDATANRIYTAGASIATDIAAAHQIYFITRYTNGTGTKSLTGQVTLEFEII